MADRTRTFKGAEYAISDAHPAADAFPWLSDDELQDLADDLRDRGQRYKVVRLPDERVIDGRNRELACRIAGIEPEYRTEEMTDDEVIDFVVSANVHRRNLSVSQRAMAAAELASMRVGDNQHKRVGNVADPLQKDRENKASQADSAQKLDVSTRSVTTATKVKNKAPELVGAVKDGSLDVTTAAKAADLPKRERKKIAESDNPRATAKKAIAKAEAKHAESVAEEKPAPLKIILPPAVDDWGIPIQPHAAEAFAVVPRFKELIQAIQHAQKLFNDVTSAPGGEFLRLPASSSFRRGKRNGDDETTKYVHTGLEDAIKHVKAATPKHTVCPYQYAEAGHPEDCRTCLNLKWTPELSSSVPPVCIDRAKAAFNIPTQEAA